MNYSKNRFINVLSFGAGVQSSTLLLKYFNEEMQDTLDFAVFADTMAEPENVYKWLKKLKSIVEPKIKIIIASNGDIVADHLSDKRKATAPLYTMRNGKQGLLRRQCTGDYKIKVVQKAIREELGYKRYKHVKHKIKMIMGISTDEMTRMRVSQIPWIENYYPLIEEINYSRTNCIDYVKSLGVGTPPRSACFFCPYRSNAEWLEMKTESPGEFKKAVDFDNKIRNIKQFGKTQSEVFLHRSCKPLGEIDFKKKENKQLTFLDECEGMCGL